MNNFFYLSGGYGDFSYSRPTMMILPKDDHPVVIVHDFFESSRQRESWVEDIRVYKSLQGLPVKLVKQVIGDLGLRGAAIGAELGREQRLGVSYHDFVALTKELSNVEFIDASDVLWELRMIKSEAEMRCQRKACEITSKAFETCFATVKEGMQEKAAVQTLLEATLAQGGSAAWVFGNSGPYNYDSGSLPTPGKQSLKRGNLLWLDTGCKFNGYASDFSRMAAIGEPSEAQKKMYETVNRITNTVVDAIRPGIKTCDLSKLCNSEFEKAGLQDLWGEGDCSSRFTNQAQRLGHGIGMMTTEPPHIALFDDTVLKPGMTITIEPTIATDDGHFNIESNVLVTEDGYEVLSMASRELIVI